MINFIELLKPQKTYRLLSKKRLGSLYDGGYVMPDFIYENCVALFTYGVGNNIEFEEDFVKTYKKPAYLFDHTIGAEEWEKNGMHFYPEGLGHDANCKDFISHYNKLSIDGFVLLKIDIEGGEYSYFLNVDMNKLESIVMGLCIEIHFMDSPEHRRQMVKILNDLKQYFILSHIHGNSYGKSFMIEGLSIPCILELSFINKRFIDKYEVDEQNFPIPNLDSPNDKDCPDIPLFFLKFH